MLGGHFSEKVISLLDLMRREDAKVRKALGARGHEPDSHIAYGIERSQKGIHASSGRNLSTLEQFERARFGREWARESEHAHKGYPAWHPEEIETPGVQKPRKGRGIGFFPKVKVKGFNAND